MSSLYEMTVRNLKNYFRDRGAVFFSLMSMLIVIGLMVFFLGDLNIESITRNLAEFPGRDAAADEKNAELIVLAWTCAGILSINAVTVTLATFSIMIKDRVNGKLNAIYTAPVSRTLIAGSYILSAWIASIIICLVTLIITEIICVSKGLEAFTAETHVKLVLMITINSFTYASFMYLLAAFAKTEGTWSSIGTVIGTLVGFLGGIYVPVGGLASSIVTVMKCTPIIYGTAMFRDVMTTDIINKSFVDVPSEFTKEYRLAMGIDLEVFDKSVSMGMNIGVLLVFGIITLILGVCVLKYGKKTDR